MEAISEALHTDGITALRGVFSRDFVHQVREDIDIAFAAAIARPDGVVPRRPMSCAG